MVRGQAGGRQCWLPRGNQGLGLPVSEWREGCGLFLCASDGEAGAEGMAVLVHYGSQTAPTQWIAARPTSGLLLTTYTTVCITKSRHGHHRSPL